MPNWGAGHSKAVESRQKKAAVKEEQRENERKRAEDAKWKDEVTEAVFSKKDQAAKLQEKAQKKAELKALADKEEAQFVSHKKASEAPAKLTRSQIQQRALFAATMRKKEEEAEQEAADDVFKLANPNRLRAEEERIAREKGQEYVAASSVAEFVDQLNPDDADRFPTKRMKAGMVMVLNSRTQQTCFYQAYNAYEEEWINKLKSENPTLKRSQMKERIWKQWQKAPENPMNQAQPQ
ncbi:coiled-coil domain-containing protein 124 [Condylostylus longicornis]|uniref:coiled-coil domain-containing protein 124 n=1 Tax=Condylostylus longicornis TaxID=2530218 RepID=UPI00244DD7F4|nr:coiled-coil domain-containing protein 124 [Condylostylus longicornis]